MMKIFILFDNYKFYSNFFIENINLLYIKICIHFISYFFFFYYKSCCFAIFCKKLSVYI